MDYCNGVKGFINYVLSIQKILVEAVLNVYVRGVKIKSFSIQMLLQCIFYKKGLRKNIYVGLHMENPIILQNHGRKNDLINF